MRRRTVRLALICAALAVAGGTPAARACYAEVSARAVAAVRAEASRPIAEPAVASPLPARLAVAVTSPAAPSRVAGRLYLAHCALLL